jgi:sialate O-acetylesterase
MLKKVPIGIIQVAVNGTGISQWTTHNGSSGRQYNTHIKPLQPFAIRGVLWYQGEDDGGKESTALKYYDMLPGLIANWRTDWKQGSFPFYYVQLAPINGRPNWAIVRDAQVATLTELNTAMACIIDVPTTPATDIHPKDKEPVGYRLALPARALIYGETDLVYSGPIRDPGTSFIQGSDIILGFKHKGSHLTTDDGALPGPFMIAGADGIYHEATAQIVGDSTDGYLVEVSIPSSVPDPESVRYCWGSYPQCNLINSSGLPASPFQLTFAP